MVFFSVIYLVYAPILQGMDLDLMAAQDAVGKRFATKFCEAKQDGNSLESSSEFALNNTYLKFVAFPNEEEFIDDLWEFTIRGIKKDCGEYVTETEEKNLRNFFREEGEIATNRDLYLPK